MKNQNEIDNELYRLLTEQPTRELKHIQQEKIPAEINETPSLITAGIATGIMTLYSFIWSFKAIFAGEVIAGILLIPICCISSLFSFRSFYSLITKN